MIVGAVCLITINTLLYGFVTWLAGVLHPSRASRFATPADFGYSLLIGARRAGRFGDRRADGRIAGGRKADHHRRLADHGSCLGNHLSHGQRSPTAAGRFGFALTVPIYVLVALLFGIYIPELFPTEVRMRALRAIVNTLGRRRPPIVTPFLVGGCCFEFPRRRRRDGR